MNGNKTGVSEAPSRAEVCLPTGKDCLTRSQAKSVAKRMNRQSKRRVFNLTAFECQHGPHWHVGNRRKRR